MAVRQVDVTITQDKDGPGTYTAEATVAGQTFRATANSADDALTLIQTAIQGYMDKQDSARRNRTATAVRTIQVETHGLV